MSVSNQTELPARLRALHAPGTIRPTTLDYAADEFERLLAENEKLRDEQDALRAENERLRAQVAELEAPQKRSRE